MNPRPWYHLTDEEVERLNPPWDCTLFFDEYGVVASEPGVYKLVHDDPGWIDVGHVPAPRTHIGWFLHHVACGLMMRYPFHKIVGFALAHMGDGEEEE